MKETRFVFNRSSFTTDRKPGSGVGHHANDYRPDPTHGQGRQQADRIRGDKGDASGDARRASKQHPNGHVQHHQAQLTSYNGPAASQSPSHNASGGAAGGGRGHIRGQIVVGLYTYQGAECGDMSFQKGDQMEILDDT